MSQTELATAMGYSGANSISKLEAGKVASIDVMVLAQIAQYTGVDISYLVPGHDALLQELRAIREEMREHRKRLLELHGRLEHVLELYSGSSKNGKNGKG